MLTITELCGFNSGAVDLTYTNAWSSTATPSNGGQFNGYTLVNKFLPGSLSASGSFVRVTLIAWSGAPMTIGALYVGHAATSGNAYNFDGNQVQGLFSGSSGVVVPGGQRITTDDISFSIDTSRAFLVAMNITTATASHRLSGLGSRFISYWKSGSSQAGTSSKAAGYSASAAGIIYCMFKIEVA